MAVSSTFVPNLEALATVCAPDRDQLIHHPPLDAVHAVSLAAEAIGESIDPEEIEAVATPSLRVRNSDRISEIPPITRVSIRLTWLPLRRDEITLCWRVELTRRQGGERIRYWSTSVQEKC